MKTALSHDSKRQRLAALTEDQFRDEVVRPLFMLQGFRSYRDVCGQDEEGKDCILLKDAEFGAIQLYAIQTKSGKLNMTRKASENIETAITQLRTALNTAVPLLSPPRMQKPDVVYLCCSGNTNTAARRHIVEALHDSRLRIMDADDAIQAIDQFYPTFWLNISHYKRRYLEAFRERLLNLSDAVFLSSGSDPHVLPFAEEAYVSQRLFRITTQITVKHGHISTDPKFEELDDNKLLSSGHELAFVTGEGGSGKTTLLRRLALVSTDSSLSATDVDSCFLPVLIRAQDLLHVDALDQHVDEAARRISGWEESGLDKEDFEKGRLVLLIDALDELAYPTAIDHALSLIEVFRAEYPRCRVVCTSRPLLQVRNSATKLDAPLYDIVEFSIKQAGRIIERVSTGDQTGHVAATEALRRLQDVHGMKLSPLLVTVFAATPNFHTSDIPPNITSIFRKFAALMLGQWDQQKGLSQQYEWDVKHRILSAVAHKWHLDGNVEASVDDFKRDVEEVLVDIGEGERVDGLTGEILRSAILVVESSTVAFRHLLFQEYFAGTAMESVDDIDLKVTDERWRNPIVFAFGARPNKGEELNILADTADGFAGMQRYTAIVSIGLALQASYMTNVAVRRELFSRVLATLAECYVELLRPSEERETFPLNAFIFHFLESRGSVSSDLILDAPAPPVSADKQEYVEFLRYAGAIEAGLIEKVERNVVDFDPADQRLLLGLDLLAVFVQKLKVSTASERQAAARVIEAIAPRVRPLIERVFEEFKGMVLELQKGKVKVLDAPLAAPEAAYELEAEESVPQDVIAAFPQAAVTAPDEHLDPHLPK